MDSAFGRLWAVSVQVSTDYGDDPALREQVARALVNTGVTLGVLDRSADALDAYQQVIDRYGDDPAPALREAVVRPLLSRKPETVKDLTDPTLWWAPVVFQRARLHHISMKDHSR